MNHRLAFVVLLLATACPRTTELGEGGDIGVDAAATDASGRPDADAATPDVGFAPDVSAAPDVGSPDAAVPGPDAGCSGVELPGGGCQPAFCSKDHFCWVNLLPTGNGMVQDFAVRSRGPGDAWIGGGRTSVLHFDGVAWSEATLPTPATLLDVFPFPGEVWAFTLHDALRWDGATWTAQASGLDSVYSNPPFLTFPKICAVSKQEVWIAEMLNAPTVLARWDGTRFESQPLPQATGNLMRLGCSPTGVWLLRGNTLFRRSAATWEALPVVPLGSAGFGPIVANTDSDVWLSGASGAGSPCAFQHWDGAAWAAVPIAAEMGTECPTPSSRPGGGLFAVATVADGSLSAWTYDGTWRRFEEAARPGDELWDRRELCRWTSEGKTCFGRGKGWQWTEWTGTAAPATNWVSRSGELWTTVNHKLARFEGLSWTLSPVMDALRFEVSPSGDLWAVEAGGGLMHFDGSAWSSVATGPATSVQDLHVTDTATFVLGGDRSLRVRQGTQWSVQPLPGTVGFSSVWAAVATDVWLSDGASFWRWDGVSLTAQAAPAGTQTISKLWGRSATNLWAASIGTTGDTRISQWDGTTWTDRTPSLGTDERLAFCDDLSSGGPHLLHHGAGPQDRILEWTGAGWLSLETGADGWKVPANQCGVEADGTIWVGHQATGDFVRRRP